MIRITETGLDLALVATGAINFCLGMWFQRFKDSRRLERAVNDANAAPIDPKQPPKKWYDTHD